MADTASPSGYELLWTIGNYRELLWTIVKISDLWSASEWLVTLQSSIEISLLHVDSECCGETGADWA